jgi:hypothetical protein
LGLSRILDTKLPASVFLGNSRSPGPIRITPYAADLGYRRIAAKRSSRKPSGPPVNHKRFLGTLPPEPVLLKTTIAGSSTRVFAEAGASFAIRGAFCAAMARVTVGSPLSWFRASAPLLYHLYWSSPVLFLQSHRPVRQYKATATRRAVRTASIASKGNGTRGDYDKLLLLSGEYQPSPLLSAH